MRRLKWKLVAQKSERPTHVLTSRVGLSEFSRRQAALKQELVFALLAVDGHRLQCPHPTEGFSLPWNLLSLKCRSQGKQILGKQILAVP